jgi:hypothetical protein
MGLFKKTDEYHIKKQIMERAKKMAEEAYYKEVAFKSLQGTTLNYTIIADLVKAANFTGKVEIQFADGTKVMITDTSVSPRQALNDGAQYF